MPIPTFHLIPLLIASHCAFVPIKLKETSSGQPENAKSLMFFTLLGIVTAFSLEQLLNALLPILVTLLPMVTEVRLEQLRNAASSMLMTLFGRVTEVNPEQPENA